MNKLLKVFALFTLMCLPILSNATPLAYVEDVHYKKTEQLQTRSDTSKVEVVELFFYGCPHCFNLEPYVEDWKETLPEDVSFRYVPAVFKESWAPLAKAFYAADKLGVLDKLHPLFFNAIHLDGQRIYTEEAIADFVAEHNIDRDKFLSAMNSFSVKTKVNKAQKMTNTSGITGVPSLIVNGKYFTGASLAGSEEEIFTVVNFLIDQEKQ